MGRNIREKLAVELCERCGMEWNKPVSFDEIPSIEKLLNCNIMVLDIESIPILGTTSSIYNSLMYKNGHVKSSTQYWLLHDQDHYHSINNIKGFWLLIAFVLIVYKASIAKKHLTHTNALIVKMGRLAKKKKKQVKSPKIGKDITHHLHKQDMKGGKDEVEGKTEQLNKILLKENEDINSEETKSDIE
jgi:hypothetical protein